MNAPSDRALLRWWDAKATELRAAGILTLTCADCGRVDLPAYVQPQHPAYCDGRTDVARCGDCLTARNVRARAHRRAERAQLPKDCERCGRRRHTWTFAGHRLCGRCKTAVAREHGAAMGKAGSLAIFATGLLVDMTTWAVRPEEA